MKAIVVTGHGRMFCAGADLDMGLSYESETVRNHRDGGGQVALALHRVCIVSLLSYFCKTFEF